MAMDRQLQSSRRSLLLVIGVLASMLTLACWPVRSQAAGQWYVSPSGSDSADCLSPATACLTIGAALGKAGAGDTITIAAGTYLERLTVNKDVTLIGAGAKQT